MKTPRKSFTPLRVHLPLVAASIMALLLMHGCGGSSHSNSITPLQVAVNGYLNAKSADQITSAVGTIDQTCGLNDPSSPYSEFVIANDADYMTWFSSECLFDHQYGIPASVGDVLGAWRANAENMFTMDTNTFLADFAASENAAEANPTAVGALVPMAILDLVKGQNAGSNTLNADTKCDTEMAHLLSMWAIVKYGLQTPAMMPDQTPADCAACKAQAQVDCNNAYNNALAAAADVKQQAIQSAQNALNRKLITQFQYNQQAAAANAAYNAKANQAKTQLQACIKNIPNVCQKECHNQGGK